MILISGCTATGKTEVGVKVCQLLEKAEIVSVDSRQVYRYMDVGTAKPLLEERRGIPHHLIDCLFPTQNISAGEYSRRAWIIINEMQVRGITPVLVGGSGLYWQAILNGFYGDDPNHKRHRANIRKRLQNIGHKDLYSELKLVDPIGCERISKKDHKRIVRALEVFYEDGIPISQKWLNDEQNISQLNSNRLMISIHRPRTVLYNRINERVEKMLKTGLVDEVQNILTMYEDLTIPAINAIGYKEIISYLNKNIDICTAKDLIAQNTRRFAKRQVTLMTKDRRFRKMDIERIGIDDCAKQIVENYNRLHPFKSIKSFDSRFQP